MAINLKSLVGKLNPLTRRALEAAAGMCLSRTNYNVEIEHWLLKLLEPADSDIARIVKHYGVNVPRANRDLTRSLDKLRTGNARARSCRWRSSNAMREAWVLASLKFNSPVVRSGHVLAALLSDRNLSGRIKQSSEELGKIAPEQLENDLPTLTADTAEAAEATRMQPAGQGDGAVRAVSPIPRPLRSTSSPRISPTRLGRARSIQSSAAMPRCGRSSTSSPAVGRTIRSSPARRGSARRPSSKDSPCESPPAMCPTP